MSENLNAQGGLGLALLSQKLEDGQTVSIVGCGCHHIDIVGLHKAESYVVNPHNW